MSAPTLSFEIAQERRAALGILRLRLKPSHLSSGPVQGAWWPHTDQLFTELPRLLTALAPWPATVDRIVYDRNAWAPASLRMEYEAHSIILEGSDTSTNTLSLTGNGFGRMVLLVVPPRTSPSHAYAAMVKASKPGDLSTPVQLLGIGAQEEQDRRLALKAQQRWESEGGALRGTGRDRSAGAMATEAPVVRHAC